MPFTIYNLFWSLCFASVYAYSNGLYIKNLEKDCIFSAIFHHMTDENRTYSNTIISRSRTISDPMDELTDNDEYCTKLRVHNKEFSSHDLESLEHYDTLTQSDIVLNQYMTLPYPAVSLKELTNEKNYYDRIYKTGIRKVPYTIHSGISFEALNHFLYKGRNTFRLALKWYFDKS